MASVTTYRCDFCDAKVGGSNELHSVAIYNARGTRCAPDSDACQTCMIRLNNAVEAAYKGMTQAIRNGGKLLLEI
jgi:hypothetical protein